MNLFKCNFYSNIINILMQQTFRKKDANTCTQNWDPEMILHNSRTFYHVGHTHQTLLDIILFTCNIYYNYDKLPLFVLN